MSLKNFFGDLFSGNFSNAEKRAEDFFSNEEKAVLTFLSPLADQIVAAGAALEKATVHEGVKVIIDAATSAVAAASTASGDKVAAAEAAFISTTEGEGITAIKNAESGAIKAAVAIAQTAITEAQAAVATPATE